MNRLLLALLVVSSVGTGEFADPFLDPLAASENLAPRHSPPSQAELQKAIEEVATLFREEYESAKTARDRAEFAQKMLKVAQETTDDRIAQFALYRVAKDTALLVGDVQSGLRAIDELDKLFDIDGCQWTCDFLQSVGSGSMLLVTRESLAKDITAHFLALMEASGSSGDYLRAGRLADAAASFGGRLQDKTLAAQIAQRVEIVRQQCRTNKEVEEALRVLSSRPDDVDANRRLAYHYCFVAGDWTRGMPYLAKSGDQRLRELVQKDFVDAREPAERLARGDAWREYAGRADAEIQRHYFRRAVAWYTSALNGATGLTKKRIERRLKELAAFAGKEVDQKLARIDGLACRTVHKLALLARCGGNNTTESCVEAGLNWLNRQQLRDGSWSLSRPYSKGAVQDNPEAATAMALLAFQGAGNTHQAGRFKDTVKRGWEALLQRQRPNGEFFHEGAFNHRFYTQAQCTIALSELYAMTKDPTCKEPAERAVRNLVASQSKEGGWRYHPNTESDVSVTSWVAMALQSAKMAKIPVPQETFDSIGKFLDKIAVDGGRRYPYQFGEKPTLAMTAAGMLCRQYLGWPLEDERLQDACKWFAETGNLIDFGQTRRDAYYWYHATQVCRHAGGGYWQKWNQVMRQAVPAQQVKGGAEGGSWDPEQPSQDKWGFHGGRLYTTCLSILILESYYRSPPLYETESPRED